MLTRALDAVEAAIATLSRYTLGRDFAACCDLRTVIGLTQEDRVKRPGLTAPYILATDTGSYATVYEIRGAFCEFDEQGAFSDNASTAPHALHTFLQGAAGNGGLHALLASEFQTMGHKLSLVFERDPDKAREELEQLMAPQFAATRRLGIDLDDILQEKIERLVPFVARERAFLVVYSAPTLLPAGELRDERKRIMTELTDAPPARYGQHPLAVTLEGLKQRHDALLDALEQTLTRNGEGVMLRLLDAHELGFALREQIDREGTGTGWQPCLPGELNWAHGRPKGDDMSCFLPPELHYQLFSQTVSTHGNRVEMEGLHHATLAMTLGPQRPETFSQLCRKISRKVPFRVRMDLMPGGMAVLGKKKAALDFLAVVPGLRPVYQSIAWLSDRNKADPVCVMTLTASTWAATPQAVRRNATLLQKAFQSWGVCEVTHTFGDPLRAWASSMTAARTAGGTHLMFPPLSQALALLPFNRPASPWQDNAHALFHTPDGRLFPVRLGTSLQRKFTEIITGEPGTGKSVLLNLLSEVVISNGQTRLPWLSVIDKGYSAQGLIRLLRDCLPDGRQDEAVGIVLRNDAAHCRNPFDVQTGARSPLEPERVWLINLLYILCTDPVTGHPPNAKDARQILGRIVDEAYRDNAERKPRRYDPGTLPALEATLVRTGLKDRHPPLWWEAATWWEVRDMLFEQGEVSAATQAQYQAVPELNDLQGWLNHDDIHTAFGKINRDGSTEPLLTYLARCLTQACVDYKMLAGRTRFALSPDTRVVAIDLNNVMGDDSPEGHLKTGLMYLFAGQVASGDYILPQYQDELLAATDPRYHALHRARLEQLDQEIKTKVYDELHNARKVSFVFSALETQDREQRKFAIRTVLSSQYLPDFPPDLLKSANALYLMQCRPEDVALLTEHFKVPLATVRRFMSMAEGPGSDGSGTPFLAVYRTKAGRIAQILKNTLGPRELWALNSTPKDSALRNALYAELDGPTARDILAEAFPTGSAEKVIDLRQKQRGEHDHDNVTRTLARELIAARGHRL